MIPLPKTKAWNRRNRRLRRQWEREGGDTDSFITGAPPNGGCWSSEGEEEQMALLGLGAIMGSAAHAIRSKLPGGSKSSGYVYERCDHWRTPVTMGTKDGGAYTVLASGLSDCPHPKGVGWGKDLPGPAPYPDLGFYLDSSWFRELGSIASAGIECPIKEWWPFIVVGWPDRGSIDDDSYKTLVELAVSKIREGKSIEVACQGGHGRTGTMLAGILATLEELSAEKAIEQLRKRYCDSAVESHEQKCQVYRYLGEQEPKKPPTPAYKSTYTPPSTLGTLAAECECTHKALSHRGKDGDGACYFYQCECAKFKAKVKDAKEAPKLLPPALPPTQVPSVYTGKPAYPKPASEVYKGFGFFGDHGASSWDEDECACSHARMDHSGSGYGECRLCTSGKCMQFMYARSKTV